jgi:superfamily I DNA and RNA helicase
VSRSGSVLSADEKAWRDVLEGAARKARCQVIGLSYVREYFHSVLLKTAIEAFGDDPKTIMYVEIRSTAGDIPRPDLILLHPELGVVVVENKGVSKEQVLSVEGTSLQLLREGVVRNEDPFLQAERVAFRLGNLTRARCDEKEVLIVHTAALPRIGREEFTRRFGTRWPDETLFAEECTDPKRFKSHIIGFCDHVQRRVRRNQRLSSQARAAVSTILEGKAFIYAPRRRAIAETDESLIGVKVQKLELALKEPTPQQREYGRADLRGSHRLFRGVAGSGKSVILALAVAHALLNYREEEINLFGKRPRKSRILVVCFNRTLVHYLDLRIEDRFGRLAWDKPGDDELVVVHFDGLLKQLRSTCPALAVEFDYSQKVKRAEAFCRAFDALPPAERERLQFDAVFVDEAQDFVPEEFAVLLRLARTDAKGGQTLALFYDNAQNIYGVVTPVWTKQGINVVGRTVFLDQCLRNTVKVIDLALNVLVGSYAPEGVRVATRRFADVESLRDRGLIEERDGRIEPKFASRTGPPPRVKAYESRNAEIEGVAEMVRNLITHHRVLPSDILILYQSHHDYVETLVPLLEGIVGGAATVRRVDSASPENKNRPLTEDGVLTLSTIASAKGYDAPVVLLLGVDKLRPDKTEDRAVFYVGATRAKLYLVVTGMRQAKPTLLDEAEEAAKAITSGNVAKPESGRAPIAPSAPSATQATPTPAPPDRKIPASAREIAKCKHCGGTELHAQYGKFGYFFRCRACTGNTPMSLACPSCKAKARVRKAGIRFYRECEKCGRSELYHVNVSLEDLNE